MNRELQPTDAELRARALASWEGEGGALEATDADDTIDDSELRILARLGAALLDSWSVLPLDQRQRIIHRARTLGGPGDRAHLKRQLARLLREHRSEC